jgi:GT2 family glycosyltransferase
MISICLTYKDRYNQFLQTLKSITHSAVTDYEIIAVDDGSEEDQRIEKLQEEYKQLKVIRINPEERHWCNPVIPYNMAFRESKGDKIIIQNAECAHIGDILAFTEANSQDGAYLNFGCLSYPENLTKKLDEDDYFESDPGNQINIIASGIHLSATAAGQLAWYNHSKFNPRALHFCSAITRSDLNKIKGFDERFKDGHNFDDNEFAWRISNSGIKIILFDNPFVVHQWHYDANFVLNDPEHNMKMKINESLLNSIVAEKLPLWSEVSDESF